MSDTRLNQKNNTNLRNNIRGYTPYSALTNNSSRGVTILIRKHFPIKIKTVHTDERDANYLMLECVIYNRKINIMGIYGPNNDKSQFYERIFDIALNNHPQHFIIAGDYNLVQSQNKDTRNYINNNNPQAREVVITKMEELNIRDHWRDTHPSSTDMTWTKTEDNKAARLDFCLSSQSLQPYIVKTEIGAQVSDHAEITTTVDLNKYPGRQKPWKLQGRLLKEPEYVRRIRELIREEELKCYGEINQNQSLWAQHRDRQDILETYRNMTPEQIHGLITQEVPTLKRVRHAGIIMDRIIEGTQKVSRAFGRERRDEFTTKVDQLRDEIALERQKDNPNNIKIQRASNELKQAMETEAEKANEQWELSGQSVGKG